MHAAMLRVEISRLGPNLQNILRQSYDFLTIMPMLHSTYDGRLIYKKNLTKGARLFLSMFHLLNCNIVRDRVRKIAYDIPKINFCTFSVTILSRSYDKPTTILR